MSCTWPFPAPNQIQQMLLMFWVFSTSFQFKSYKILDTGNVIGTALTLNSSYEILYFGMLFCCEAKRILCVCVCVCVWERERERERERELESPNWSLHGKKREKVGMTLSPTES